MNANVTALHHGRTRALVQRKGRKAHIGSWALGEDQWTAVCGRYIPAAGALIWTHDAVDVGVTVALDGHFCQDCEAITNLVAWAVDHAIAQLGPSWKAAAR